MDTPELDKMLAARKEDHSQKLGEFLDWLQQQGIHLAEYREIEGFRDSMLLPIHDTFEQLLARYFGVDLDAVERERRAILEEVRSA